MPNPIAHFDAAVVKIDKEDTIVTDESEPNVQHPTRNVRVVTVNGEIWDKVYYTFGLTVELIIKEWQAIPTSGKNLTEHGWTRFDT